MNCPRFRLKERFLNDNIWYCWTCNKDWGQSTYGCSMVEMSVNMEVSMCSKGRLLGMPLTLRQAGWTSVLALIVPVQTVFGPCLCSRLTDFLPQSQELWSLFQTSLVLKLLPCIPAGTEVLETLTLIYWTQRCLG